jgi:hypothetical protein
LIGSFELMTIRLGKCANSEIGFGGRGGADIAAGAGTVVDHERLPDRLAHPLQQDPQHHVAGAAACESDDDLDRPCRIGLGVRGLAGHDGGEKRSRAQREPLRVPIHWLFLRLEVRRRGDANSVLGSVLG